MLINFILPRPDPSTHPGANPLLGPPMPPDFGSPPPPSPPPPPPPAVPDAPRPDEKGEEDEEEVLDMSPAAMLKLACENLQTEEERRQFMEALAAGGQGGMGMWPLGDGEGGGGG